MTVHAHIAVRADGNVGRHVHGHARRKGSAENFDVWSVSYGEDADGNFRPRCCVAIAVESDDDPSPVPPVGHSRCERLPCRGVEVDVAAQSANLPRECLVRAVVQRYSAVAEDNSHVLAVEVGVVGVDAGGVESVNLVCANEVEKPRVLPRLVECLDDVERDPRARYCGRSRATIFNWKSTASDL